MYKLVLMFFLINLSALSQSDWSAAQLKMAYDFGSPKSSRRRIANSNLITGDAFRAIAKHVFDETDVVFDSAKVKDGDTIFVKTDFLSIFFKYQHNKIRCRYILITHNADTSVPGVYKNFLDSPNLIAWFGMNPDIRHPKLIAIPIGLENEHWSGGLAQKTITEVADLQVDKRYLLLMNFNINTNVHERRPVFEEFKTASYCYVPASRKPFREYLLDLKAAKFCLSPFGNGKDCHRVWEAIAVGCIPIVKTSNLDVLYQRLPVLIVGDWNVITQEFLEEQYKLITQQKLDTCLLDSNYWQNSINFLIKEQV